MTGYAHTVCCGLDWGFGVSGQYFCVLCLQVPQLIPKAFPVTVSFTDILKKVDDHPTCGPIPISDSVFDLLWRRYRGISNLMSLKILVLAPYMFEEEMCTSLPSYWLLRKLSCRRVGLGKDHELNQMISKGSILLLLGMDISQPRWNLVCSLNLGLPHFELSIICRNASFYFAVAIFLVQQYTKFVAPYSP